MESKFSISEHGDSLEKENSNFIRTYFSTYESVWQLFIGNKGNDTKADIEGFPIDRDEQRQKFSEHTYTILQSVILSQRILKKESFNAMNLSLNEALDLHDNLLLFFTHLGRIRDNVEEASTCLINCNTKEITGVLDELYHKRHIMVHGKMIPLNFKITGEISLPILSKSGVDVSGWNHKQHSWKDTVNLPSQSLRASLEQVFWDLLPKLSHIFGEFKNRIESELGDQQFKLKFEIIQDKNLNPYGSGSNAREIVSIYGIGNTNPYKL